jgi:hypothetical protein
MRLFLLFFVFVPLFFSSSSEVNEKLGGLSKEPLHDQYSHAADAFRMAAVMIKNPERKREQEKRRPASKLSPWS